jgi:hypothetical protein
MNGRFQPPSGEMLKPAIGKIIFYKQLDISIQAVVNYID